MTSGKLAIPLKKLSSVPDIIVTPLVGDLKAGAASLRV
jgi:hypothetical protein